VAHVSRLRHGEPQLPPGNFFSDPEVRLATKPRSQNRDLGHPPHAEVGFARYLTNSWVAHLSRLRHGEPQLPTGNFFPDHEVRLGYETQVSKSRPGPPATLQKNHSASPGRVFGGSHCSPRQGTVPSEGCAGSPTSGDAPLYTRQNRFDMRKW
jgi:hypothetical protein